MFGSRSFTNIPEQWSKNCSLRYSNSARFQFWEFCSHLFHPYSVVRIHCCSKDSVPSPGKVNPMLANWSYCNNLFGCVTALCSIQDMHSQRLNFYNWYQGGLDRRLPERERLYVTSWPHVRGQPQNPCFHGIMPIIPHFSQTMSKL